MNESKLHSFDRNNITKILIISLAILLFYYFGSKRNETVMSDIRNNLGVGYAIVSKVNTDGFRFKNGTSLVLDIYIHDKKMTNKYYYSYPGDIYCAEKLIGKSFPFVYSTKHSDDGSKYSRVLILKKDFSNLGLKGQPDSLSWVNECFEGQCYGCDN